MYLSVECCVQNANDQERLKMHTLESPLRAHNNIFCCSRPPLLQGRGVIWCASGLGTSLGVNGLRLRGSAVRRPIIL